MLVYLTENVSHHFRLSCCLSLDRVGQLHNNMQAANAAFEALEPSAQDAGMVELQDKMQQNADALVQLRLRKERLEAQLQHIKQLQQQ